MSTTDEQREAALSRYGVHDLGSRRQLQALVDLAALVCEVPMAAINLIGATDQHRVATVGIGREVCSREGTMCSVSMFEAEPVFVPDARVDDRFRTNAFVTGERAMIRFYASHQLRTPEGVVIGTICVFDTTPRDLSEGQFTALGTLAEQVVDVLELELLTTKLARANSRLETSNERLADFAGQVSHDLKNPLNAISLSLGMAKHTSTHLPREHRQPISGLLDKAERGTGRMSQMITNLLDYARSGAAPERAPVNLASVVDAVLEDLRDLTLGFTITIGGLPELRADELQMRVLLQNLIGNALKFTRETTHPVVCVRGRTTAEGWRIEVLDNGPGIAADQRERVFDLFARSASHQPGSGIGLSTCRKIIDAHGGRIGVTRAPTGGTLVWVEIPGRLADAESLPVSA